jgi:hypothetical protein
VTCDNTGELLAIRLRPGNAGANTAADHLDILGEAFAQVPAAHRRHLLVRGDSAAATHAVLDWLTAQDTKRGRRVGYSIGWAIGETERAAISALAATAWTPASAADRGVPEGADVAGLLDLPGWPAGMRVIVRRERPHPGAQLSLFEERAMGGATPRSSPTPPPGSCNGWRPATGHMPVSRTGSAAPGTPAFAGYRPASSPSTTPGAPWPRSPPT